MPSSNIKNESKSSTSTSDTHPQKDKSPIKREEVKASITSLAPNGACLPMLGNNFTIGTGEAFIIYIYDMKYSFYFNYNSKYLKLLKCDICK